MASVNLADKYLYRNHSNNSRFSNSLSIVRMAKANEAGGLSTITITTVTYEFIDSYQCDKKACQPTTGWQARVCTYIFPLFPLLLFVAHRVRSILGLRTA